MATSFREADAPPVDMARSCIRLKNKSDLIHFMAREIAPALFHTEEELTDALERAAHDAAAQDGLALPCIILPRLARPFTALFTLEHGADFAASDARAVDLILIMALPEKDGAVNRVRLSRMSRVFKSSELCNRLRDAQSENEIFAILMESQDQRMAA